jgi:hypothetical protein
VNTHKRLDSLEKVQQALAEAYSENDKAKQCNSKKRAEEKLLKDRK